MRRRLERVASAVSGRRGRWLVVAVWLPLALAGALAHARIGDVTAAGQSSYLPADAQSTRALDAMQVSYGGGEDIPVLIVFDRGGGLRPADLRAIARLGRGIERLRLAGATPVLAPYSDDLDGPLADVARVAAGVGPISRDGEAALVGLAIDAEDRGAVTAGVDRIRAYLERHRPAGLRSYVTGPAGMAADLEAVADEAGRTLLIATLALVLLLLLLVYRAPLLGALPLLVVGSAYLVTLGLVYLLIEAGAIVVNAEGTMLLLVLIFGAGTDYSLLLVHRYREELGRRADARAALPAALTESGPALAASAATVIAAMLILLLADLESTRWLGPILAIGIATVLVASFTLLPALLAILGGRAFWPAAASARRSPRSGDGTGEGGAWVRVSALVRRRPRALVAAILAALALLAAGNLVDHGTIGFGQGDGGSSESSRGNRVIAEHFPPGLASPLTAVVESGELGAALAGLDRFRPVKLAMPVPPAPGSDRALMVIVLRANPYSAGANDAVAAVRERLNRVAPSALVGGVPAQNLDVESTNERDTRLIVPLVLLVIGLILVAVLRALAAPAYLIATTVASIAATLGLVTVLFTELLGGDGIAFNLVLIAFIFLVALGVDYNIFLMTRARREAARIGTRDGVLAALEDTGGVVTGAGLILAGTFATLTLLPLEQLAQIGATVAIGVLLDAFVVRALLVPAITRLLGERAWWPSPGGVAAAAETSQAGGGEDHPASDGRRLETR